MRSLCFNSLAISSVLLFSGSLVFATQADTTSCGKEKNSYFEQGLYELDNFQPDKAIIGFSRALLNSENASRAVRSKIFLLIGRAFQLDENEKAAVQALSIAHELNPDDQVTTALLAYGLVRAGHREKAAPHFQWLKSQKNKTRMTWIVLSLEAAKTSDLDGAKNDLETALKESGAANDAYVHLAYGRLLTRMGQTNDAKKQFTAAFEMMKNPYSKKMLEVLLERLEGNTKKQIELLKEAGQIEPNEPGWHYELADCYAGEGRKPSAIDQYNLAMRGRFSARAYQRAISFLRNEKRYDDAIKLANELVRMKPWSADSHLTLGNLYFHQKKYDEAERELKAAVQLDKFNENSYTELARQYTERQMYEKARDAYKAGLQYSPKSLGLLRRLGDVEARLKNEPAARQCYDKIIAQVSSVKDVNVLFQNEYALAQAKMGSRYYAEQQPSKALAAAKLFNKFKFVPNLPPLLTLLHLRPAHLDPPKTPIEQDYDDHIMLADMLREGGKIDECIAEYRKAEAINPDDVDLHSFLLNALDEKGDMLGAAREDLILSSKLVNRVPAEVKKFAGGDSNQGKQKTSN